MGQFEFLTQRVTSIEIQTAVLSCFHSTLRTAFFALPAGRFLRETGALIFDDLRAIQLRHGFLPKAELESLSARTQTPLYQLHSVASFYPHFHLVPPPRAEIRVCADMSCHLNGACELRADLETRFAGSSKSEVEIRDVSCLGRCDHAPAVSINDRIFTNVTAENAEALARAAIRGDELHEDHPPAEVILEETYYYRTQTEPEGAFAVQRLYSPRHGLDLTETVRDGDIMLVPHGYHTTAAAHGYDLYYLNGLAGERRSMAAADDPLLAWIRPAWADLEPDPRVPMVTLEGRR